MNGHSDDIRLRTSDVIPLAFGLSGTHFEYDQNSWKLSGIELVETELV